MRNLKKVLSLTLALVMLIGMMVVGASAAAPEFTDVNAENKEEAIKVMSAVEVFVGNGDGTFNPDGKLTRAEASTLILRMSAGNAVENAVKGSTSLASNFTDVPAGEWYAPYIAYATNMGWVNGNGDGTFSPEGNVTGYEFGKMLLGVLGYTKDETRYTKAISWELKVLEDMVKANVSMLTGLDNVDLSKPLTREQAAQMALNAAQCNVVTYSKDSGELSEGQTPKTLIATNTARFGTGANALQMVTGTTVDKLGHPTQEWKFGNTVVSASSIAEATKTVKGEDFAKATTLKDLTFTNTKYYYNGVERTVGEFDMDGKYGATIEVYITGTNVDRIVATEPYFTVVKEVKSDKVTLTVYEAGYIRDSIDSGNPATVVINKDDSDFALVKDMAEKDVFMGVFNTGNWCPSDSSTRTPLISVDTDVEPIEGKVTAKKILNDGAKFTGGTITVEGTPYKFSSEYSRVNPALGTTGTLYVYNGYAYHFAGETVAAPETLYAVVDEIVYVAPSGSGLAGSSDNASIEVRLITPEGESIEGKVEAIKAKIGSDTTATTFKIGGTGDVKPIVSTTSAGSDKFTGAGSAVTNLTMHTATGNNGDLKNRLVEYTVNSKTGAYTLTYPKLTVSSGTVTMDAGNKETVTLTADETKAITTKGNPTFSTDKTANNKTVFLVKTAKGYNTYTGFNEVETITVKGASSKSISAVVDFIAKDGVASVVYIDASAAKDGAAEITIGETVTVSEVVYILNATYSEALDGNDTVKLYDAVVDGAVGTVKVKNEGVTISAAGLYTVTKSGDVITGVEAAEDTENGGWVNKTVTAKPAAGVLKTNDGTYAYDGSETVVMVGKDGKVVENATVESMNPTLKANGVNGTKYNVWISVAKSGSVAIKTIYIQAVDNTAEA